MTENSTWEGDLTAAQWASLAFGDVNNDNRSDLVQIGCTGTTGGTLCSSYIAKVYINNGTSLAENSTWENNLTELNSGSLSLGDLDNDGDLDLIAIGCENGGGRQSACNTQGKSLVYINNGTSFVENSTWQSSLTATWKGSTSLGDIDNDGKLDLVIISTSIAKVYINNGTTLIENSTWQGSLTVAYGSSTSLGDIDNDGKLDLVAIGDTGSGNIAKVYINNGSTLTENSTWQGNLLPVEWAAVSLGDFDNDGDLDLSLIGHTSSDIHRIYRNNGGTFIELGKEIVSGGRLVGCYGGSLAFGDYDNDGYLDLVSTGKEGYTTIYRYNTPTNNFTFDVQDVESNVTDLEEGSSAMWVDTDNDGNLDLIETGYDDDPSTPPLAAKIYINNITTTNTLPNASTSFSSSFANGLLTLTWGNGSDVETPANGLYYNLRVGTSSGSNNIVSGVYGGSSGGSGGGNNGYFGNMMQRKSISLSGLSSSTTYYWSVQTIDTGLRKSNWSTEQTYTTVSNIVDPVITLNSPVHLYNTTNATIVFNVNVTDDSGLANVTLWGNWTGSFIANETNSTNLVNGTYTFSKNLSSYGDGIYAWKIRACDLTSNCINSSTRTFMIDTASPSISLITPTDASTWTSLSTVTFTYNVSDLAIANCSLIIDNSIVENDTSITINTQQTFSRSLSNAAYTWSINCTDYTNHTNNSTARTLTVSYTAPVTSGGGGGGGGTTGITYVIGALEEGKEAGRILGEKDVVKFILTGEEHKISIKAINPKNATIEVNSTPVNFTLLIGEVKKLNLTSSEFYDLLVKLNNISNYKANLTIMAMHEAISAETSGKEKTGGNVTAEKGKEEEKIAEERQKLVWIPIALTILVAACLAYYFWKKARFKALKKA